MNTSKKRLGICSESPDRSHLGSLDARNHRRECLATTPRTKCTQQNITSLLLLAALYVTQARKPLDALATWAHYWLMLSRHLTSPDPFPWCSLPATLSQACSAAWDCCDQRAGLSTWSHWSSSHCPPTGNQPVPDPSAGPCCLQTDQHFHPTQCHHKLTANLLNLLIPIVNKNIKQDISILLGLGKFLIGILAVSADLVQGSYSQHKMDKDHTVLSSANSQAVQHLRSIQNVYSMLFSSHADQKLFYLYVKDFQFFKWFGKTWNLLSPTLCTLPELTTFTVCATPHSCRSIQGGLKCAKFHYHGWKVTLTRTESLYLCTHVSSANKHCKYWICRCLGTKAPVCPASGHGPKSAFKGPPAPAKTCSQWNQGEFPH